MEVLKYCGELKNKDVAKPQKQQEAGTWTWSKIQLPPHGKFPARSLSLSYSILEEYIICLKVSFVFLIHKMRNMVARMPGFPSYHPGTPKKMNFCFFQFPCQSSQGRIWMDPAHIRYPLWNSLVRHCLNRLGEKSGTRQTVPLAPNPL